MATNITPIEKFEAFMYDASIFIFGCTFVSCAAIAVHIVLFHQIISLIFIGVSIAGLILAFSLIWWRKKRFGGMYHDMALRLTKLENAFYGVSA